MSEPIEHMPVPFMGPPVLIDKKAGFAIAQMPAIVLYLGETLGLMPATPALRAMTMKTVKDVNDAFGCGAPELEVIRGAIVKMLGGAA